MSNDPEIKTYPVGDLPLVSGQILPQAFLAYKTYGDPALPAIIYPTWYSGLIADNEWLIGVDKALSPEKYFIIVPALFGNGESSSPSNMPHVMGPDSTFASESDNQQPSKARRQPFPDITFKDNVTAQYKLVTQGLGITHARAVLGWSMGAGQTYQWLTQYPDFMDLGIPFCGAAKTSVHNLVFLEGVKSALLAAKGTSSGGACAGEAKKGGGEYRTWTAEERESGLKALGRVYAGWGFSQAFYREKVYEKLGYGGLEEFMVGFWEKWALSKDPENMLVMLHTWQAGDCSAQEPYNGDFEASMRAIKAKTLVLPSKTDLYFPPEDSEYEVANMTEGVGKYIAFPSIWGHWAGGPGTSKADLEWLDEKLRIFLPEGTFP